MEGESRKKISGLSHIRIEFHWGVCLGGNDDGLWELGTGGSG